MHVLFYGLIFGGIIAASRLYVSARRSETAGTPSPALMLAISAAVTALVLCVGIIGASSDLRSANWPYHDAGTSQQ